ncbi:hypothetical protein A1D23_13300 [Chelonobacter oris]|uniref:Uncharacterized protein n=1 Tax=Chelonobacter oris TaxID=505317 RepID=A0A0A3AQH7_9PAST|nr:hypothetical protein [Chelonobacter oris]KGQ69360.1 hypothetical protein OA57_12030 [Chelonobacter oris]MDH3001561.1 hypothetical protein [Chelonobacter oris]
MNKLINSTNDFGFFWSENYTVNRRVFGEIRILIGEELYPRERKGGYTLQTVFSNLKDSFINKYYPAGISEKLELGEEKFDIQKWDLLELKDVFEIEVTELGGGRDELVLCMGYSGKWERLFYSFDNGSNFREIKYPIGTVEKIVNLLPNYL